MARTLAILLLLPFISSTLARGAEEFDFDRQIRPIFQAHCAKCHGADKQQGGLRFDQSKSALGRADSGEKAIEPGNSAKSEMIRRISSTDKSIRMPPEGERLSEADVGLLRRWIDAGAKGPEDAKLPAGGRKELVVTPADREHWSFQPLREVALPQVRDAAWVRSPVDPFVLARMEKEGAKPRPVLDARRLTRRAYFDVIGLPPENSAAPSYEALIEELLGRPQFGERWARHWLDVARYADSNGQEADQDRPTAYHYRDFVIHAFNTDLPYDTFVRWQIAGDEIEPGHSQAIAATGFLTAGPHTVLDVPMEEEKLRNRYNELDDIVSTFGTSLLGLTLGCARCHDHKYDAIPSRDYYRLMAAFHNGDRAEVPLASLQDREQYQRQKGDWDRALAIADGKLQAWLKENRAPIESTIRGEKIDKLALSDEQKVILRALPQSNDAKAIAKKHEKELAVAEGEIQSRMSERQRAEWQALGAAVSKLRDQQPKSLATAFAYRDFGPAPRTTWLFRRGDFQKQEEEVKLGFLSVLTGQKSPEIYWEDARQNRGLKESSYQRKAVADWITDTKQGAGALLARVIVNRIWQHYFGEGIVRTASDFGVQGERPSNPELLEWLANDLVAHNWKLKRIHHLILTSAAYRQSLAAPRRLEAEIIRDSMLAVSGKLNRQVYGSAFKPPIAPEAMVARNLKDGYPANVQESADTNRRSIYMFHKRVVPYPLLQTFDAPDAQQACGRRDQTTVAPQALALFNDPFVRARADDFANRVLAAEVAGEKAGDSDWKAIVVVAYKLALGREPSEAESAASIAFLQSQLRSRRERGAKQPGIEKRQALADFCQALFSLNEFIYID